MIGTFCLPPLTGVIFADPRETSPATEGPQRHIGSHRGTEK